MLSYWPSYAKDWCDTSFKYVYWKRFGHVEVVVYVLVCLSLLIYMHVCERHECACVFVSVDMHACM
jgi:hypothetical protein